MNTLQRIESRIERVPFSTCWLYTGPLTHDGYARVTVSLTKKKQISVYGHRALFEHYRGPIPAGLTLDHLCRVRCCVNPVHLEPVPLQVNIARGNYGWRGQQTHCKYGHLFDEENTRKWSGRRVCRKCEAKSQRAYQLRKKS